MSQISSIAARKSAVSVIGGQMKALLWEAEGSGHRPGILLIQEIFGLNANMRAAGDWLARSGFSVIAPDLFWRLEPGIDLDPTVPEHRERATALLQRFDHAHGLIDCAAAIDVLKGSQKYTGKVGVVGYCLGGKLAFQLARSSHAHAVVAFYPVGVMALGLSAAKPPETPLLVHLGEQDPLCPPDAQAVLKQHLAGAPNASMHTYAGVGHAFARLGRTGVAAEAAELAERRTLEFLRARLG